jgi:putative DNA primase/helicase
VARPSLPTCPGIDIQGNAPGVGKGLLARALGALCEGTVPAVVTEGHSPEELEKRLSAAVLGGVGAILLDNLQRPLASSTLESMLTEPVADIRSFGKLELIRAPCRALVLMTENNTSKRMDMVRRLIPIRIVVPTENPELRRFDFDPVDEVLQDRSELLEAAFTILLAWRSVRDAGENREYRLYLGSYPEWSGLVASSVYWLTGIDPISFIEAEKAANPSRLSERDLIEALHGWQRDPKRPKGKDGEECPWEAREAALAVDNSLWTGLQGDSVLQSGRKM